MAIIVDLDDDASADPAPAQARSPNASGFPNLKALHHSLVSVERDEYSNDKSDSKTGSDSIRPNPNINGFSAALSCYP